MLSYEKQLLQNITILKFVTYSLNKSKIHVNMNAAPTLPFPAPPAPANAHSRAARLKALAPACCSLLLHALLLGIAILLTLGGAAGGGMPGNGAGSALASDKRLRLAGMLTLNGESAAATGKPLPSAQENAADAESEKAVQVQEAEQHPAQQEADAIPIAARIRPKPGELSAKDKPRQQKKPQPAPRKRAEGIAAGQGREPQPEARAASGAMERSGAMARAAADQGAAGDETAGRGSGLHPGSGGNQAGAGNQGAGFAGKVDSKPRVLRRSKVKYPELARKSKITGHVLLRFHLDEKGSISRLQVLKADPPGVFEAAALAAVKEWSFAPAIKDGRPVPYWVELPMPFILR